jgi:phosphoheptose isomerase
MVVMDHHGAKLYHVDATSADASQHTIKPYDPHHFQHHLTHKDQSREEGQRTAEDPGFYEEIAHALAGAGKIVVVGHGHGKSNASLHLVEHLRAQHSEIHRRIASELSADLSAVTTADLLELARKSLR